MTPPRLDLRAISKSYFGTPANQQISLTVQPGEIHAVLGENGAGKSTLMKIIGGVTEADSGEIRWDGERVRISHPSVATRLGISMLHQHSTLFEPITVLENIALAVGGRFDLAALADRVAQLAERYDLPVALPRPVHDLSVGERQRVEILRCLLLQPKLLILDEPTAVLTPAAVRQLFIMLRRLAAEGCSILYISHKLEEIRALCQRATVLRGGRVVASVAPAEHSAAALATLMVGSAPPSLRAAPAATGGRPRLELIGLSAPAADRFGSSLADVALSVAGGEVVGIAGVSGNGQRELLALLSGEVRCQSDMISLDGIAIGDQGVAARRGKGLAVVPEERLGRASVPSFSLADNTLLTAHDFGLVGHGLVRRRRCVERAAAIIDRFAVRAGGPLAPAATLSGGNLQKFIVGREIGLAPGVLIVAQPTWGVDVTAAAMIRQTLIDVARQGAAVLVVSEELDELFEVSDRIAVMAQGRLSPAQPRAGLDRETIGLMMAGSRPKAA